MSRRSLTLAGLVAALLGCSVLTAPALAADHHRTAPTARSAGLLDGLGGLLGPTLGGLLGGGGSQEQQLQQLLSALQSGQAPTPATLAPLQGLLGQLGTTPGLPAATQGLLAQITGLLAGAPAGQPLDAGLLAPVATLLHDLAGTEGVPTSAATLLNQLADLLGVGAGSAALPIEGLLELPPQLVDDLDELLQELENGGEPTGRLLAPVVTLLNDVAAADGLPTELSELLRQLGDTLSNTAGALDPLLTSQISRVLTMISNTPGITPGQRTTIERISTLLQTAGQSTGTGSGAGSGSGSAGAGARAATASDRARITRVSVNRARTRIGVRLACPRSAPSTCAVTVRAKLAGRKAAPGKRVRIGAGKAKVVRLRMVRAARTSSVRSGGVLRVSATTAFGAKRFAETKARRLAAQA